MIIRCVRTLFRCFRSDDEQGERIGRSDFEATSCEVVRMGEIVDRPNYESRPGFKASISDGVFLSDYHEGREVGEQLLSKLQQLPEKTALILRFDRVRVLSSTFADPCLVPLIRQSKKEIRGGQMRYIRPDRLDTNSVKTVVKSTFNTLDYPTAEVV